MKRAMLWMAVVALVPTSQLRSEKTGDKAPVPVPGAGVASKSFAKWYIEDTGKIVQLTTDQKQAIAKIFDARDRQTKDFEAKNAEKAKAVSAVLVAAYKTKDKDAIAKATKAQQELYAPMQVMWKKSQADLMSVLTAQQRTKLSEHQLTTSVKAVTNPVSLTDEQWRRIRAAWNEGRDGERQKYAEVLQEVLTVKQKSAIAKYRLMDAVKMNFRRANLTADQLKTIEAACDEFSKGYSKLGLEPGIWGKTAEKVNGLLNAEQKDALKKTR